MKEVYLIYWWCPEPYIRESRFYATDPKIDKKKLEACAHVSTWKEKWRDRTLSEAIDNFENERKERFRLARLNIKATHDLHVPYEKVRKHYQNFIKPENIIFIEINSAPKND